MQYLRELGSGDLEYLAPRLRMADLQEIHAAVGKEPLTALRESVEASDYVRTLVAPGGAPVGVMGVTDFGPLGIIWMMATQELENYAITFLRSSRAEIESLQARWSILTNCVDERNTTHIKWLKWLGFTFIRRHPHWGFEQRPFIEFVRISLV